MSNLETDPDEIVCTEGGTEGGVEVLAGREVPLGGPRAMPVTRTLPHVRRRMIGAWCFVDAYGPEDTAMRVPPHPHTGLQTVTWLLEGEVEHRDSLGNLQTIKPGQLNVMTAGRGISHSEQSSDGGRLHGVQLWVALPGEHRAVAPAFEHHADLPVAEGDGFVATWLMGGPSPATTYTPLDGAEVRVEGRAVLPLERGFEHGLLLLDGQVTPLPHGSLIYVPPGRDHVVLEGNGRVLLIGGEPFAEEIVMWWNFVGRSHDDIVAFRDGWMDGTEFGTVTGFDGDPLPAPALPGTRLRARGRVR
ncbi:pirin family protein [Nonomuraea sp. NBC_01738]|uniref:pirin family protein n=1 Tax=Nonomuraea sp. NBC_01738 TaxID=2976003 RepID=UPI002E0DDB44|nr:pirin family protein [Nonomuraea sp. NBC_01738]